MHTDDALVAECLRGDEEAFRRLVECHRPRMLALAGGMLQDPDQAADAVQEAFLKAYRALATYRGRGEFTVWLRRILVNHCLSLLRQRHQYLSLEELEREPAAGDRGPEATTLAASQAELIRGAMSRLPAHYRAALVLRLVEGLSYREISTLLEVPESTIETWIHRGRLRLRALLLATDGEGAPRPQPGSGATPPPPRPRKLRT